MALEDKIQAVEKLTKALESKDAVLPESEIQRVVPNKEHFETLMSSEKQKSGQSRSDTVSVSESSTSTSSLMDEVRKLHTTVDHVSKMTPEDLRNQANDLIAQMGDVKSKLAQVEDIKPAYQNLLQNRLTHIDDSLKIALSKAGVEYAPTGAEEALANNLSNKTINPVERFLGYLTQGQYQLEHLQQTIEGLELEGKQLTPAGMLSLQIKVGQIQQEIELFTSLLNKALESTKTLMNVQV